MSKRSNEIVSTPNSRINGWGASNHQIKFNAPPPHGTDLNKRGWGLGNGGLHRRIVGSVGDHRYLSASKQAAGRCLVVGHRWVRTVRGGLGA